ncbi:MAG: MaoC family dehydratase [bacterium]
MIQTKGSVAKKLKAGDRAVFTRTFTEAETMMFVGLSGDFNPHHVDAEFCKLTKFGRPIVPGFLVGAMATHIGGQWAVLASQFHLDFLAPVYIGDTVTCEAIVADVTDKYRVRVEFTCALADGTLALKGYFLGYPPKEDKLSHLCAERGKLH